MTRLSIRRAAGWVLVAVALVLAAPAAVASAAETETMDTTFTTSDGVVLRGTLSGEAPLSPRPTVVEFSPYGVNSGSLNPGPGLNNLVIEDRGTGRSGGSFEALGPLAQQDVKETLDWACQQPWSAGAIGLNGFSASAITIYNSLHLKFPDCVKTAVLRSGTFELYRDLLSPGGISNTLPGAVVITGIGGGALQAGGERDPADTPDATAGNFGTSAQVLAHPNLDAWWAERGFRGDVNHLPILMVVGFYDVESRGAFEGYQALKDDGAKLYVISGHDQPPKGTDAGRAHMQDWFARRLLGTTNGIDEQPRVQLFLSRGDRRAFKDGDYARYDAPDWPVPGLRYQTLNLMGKKSGTANSINDGSLSPDPATEAASASYPATISMSTQTDVPNAAAIDGGGASALTDGFPALADMRSAEPQGLSFTSPPVPSDVYAIGPAALDLQLSSTAPTTAIWSVISDVGPDGIPHAIATGRLSSDYPNIVTEKSRTDAATGEIVQPYGDFSTMTPATPGQTRAYRIEFWPLGNVFRAGHRIRVHLVGQSMASKPDAPAVNTVTLGGMNPSRLLLPVAPVDGNAATPTPAPLPFAATTTTTTTRGCPARRTVVVKVRHRKRLKKAIVRVRGKRVAKLRRGHRKTRLTLTRRVTRVRITIRLKGGKTINRTRTYRSCR